MPTRSSMALAVSRRSSLLPIFQIVSGSATMSVTCRRGFSEEIGSWKIIWTCVRSVRRSQRLERGDLDVVEADPARRGLLHLHDGPPRRRLAAARLADQAERLALAHGEGDARDRLHGGVALAERDVEVLDREQRVGTPPAAGGAARGGVGHAVRLLGARSAGGAAPDRRGSGAVSGYQQA